VRVLFDSSFAIDLQNLEEIPRLSTPKVRVDRNHLPIEQKETKNEKDGSQIRPPFRQLADHPVFNLL